MDKNLKIVIIDDSKASYVALKTMLGSMGFKNITYFSSPLQYIEYLQKASIDDIDIVFIDYQMPEMNGLKVLNYTKKKFKDIITVMMTSSTDTQLKQKAIEYGVNEFMNKGIDFFEFKTKMTVLSNLRTYYYESRINQEKLEVILQYKDTQENLAVQKQLKIIEDKISNHFYNEWLMDSYFKPKDILSGDSYSTLQIDDNKFFISIVDGMGKGISASLSSVLTVSFMNYAIKKSIEFNDFNFQRVVRDTFNYAASIMLDNEALSFCMAEVDLSNNKIKYANMGMPPFYLVKNNEIIKIKPNNKPLLQNSTEYVIDEYTDGFDTFLVASDGLFESVDSTGYPYFVRFKQKFKEFYLLQDLIRDFKQNVAEADDDTTIVFMKKDNDKYDEVLSENILLMEKDIENFVNNVEFELNDKLPIKVINKIVFALNELLINCYEHSVLKISKNKHQIIQKDEKIEYNGEKQFANLVISKSEKYAVIDLSDNGEGFDVSQILKSEWFNKYHGRGIKMLKKFSDGMYYNKIGNRVKIYFKL
jgi:CheY-like chemotaxis protein